VRAIGAPTWLAPAVWMLEALTSQLDEMNPLGTQVHVSRKRAWPQPTPMHRVVVQAGPMTVRTEHADLDQAILAAFQQVFDQLEPLGERAA